MYKKIVSAILTVAFTTACSGCSMFVPSKQKFSVTSSESDAKIYGEFNK